MRYYPVFLDINRRPVVVIGGGEIALRKVEGLLEAGAQVTVISPQLHPDLRRLLDDSRVRHIEREYQGGDLQGYFLAFVGTDDRGVNAIVAREGKERRVWVNAVDDTENCDFIMPSVIRQGDLVVAISTSGASPAVARKIREELSGFLTEEYALLLDLAAEVRRELREQDVLVEPEIWKAALDEDLKGLLAQGRRAEAKDRLVRSLLQPTGDP